MPLATAATISAATGLSAALVTKAASRAAHAERHCRSRLGDDRYDALAAGPDAALVEAESLLTLSFGLPFMNLKITETGGVVKATGVEDKRTEVMGAKELACYRDALVDQAETILGALAEAGAAPTFLIDVI